MLAHGPLSPRVIAAQRDPERSTQHTHGIVLAIVFHDLVPHSWPCEKILTIFLIYRVPVAFSPVPVSGDDFLPPGRSDAHCPETLRGRVPPVLCATDGSSCR